VLDQISSKIYIKFEFRVTWIWLLNLKVIDEKFSPIEVYTTQLTNREETKHSNLDLEYEEEENQHWGEVLTIEKLFSIAITSKIVNTSNE